MPESVEAVRISASVTFRAKRRPSFRSTAYQIGAPGFASGSYHLAFRSNWVASG
jgi:hypothetical protein